MAWETEAGDVPDPAQAVHPLSGGSCSRARNGFEVRAREFKHFSMELKMSVYKFLVHRTHKTKAAHCQFKFFKYIAIIYLKFVVKNRKAV